MTTTTESLVARLAREAVRRNLRDIPGADERIDDEMLPIVHSGMYQLAHGAIRAALTEAARALRDAADRGETDLIAAVYLISARLVDELRDGDAA